jgi:hypothetical protein
VYPKTSVLPQTPTVILDLVQDPRFSFFTSLIERKQTRGWQAFADDDEEEESL